MRNFRPLIVYGFILAVAGTGWQSDSLAQQSVSSPPPTALWLSANPRTTPVGPKLHGGLLTRELVRQAVLMAARDELGTATRDEGLGDPMPENAGGQTISLRIHVVTPRPNRFRIELTSIDKAPEARVYTRAFDVNEDPVRYYATLVQTLERESRASLLAALETAGLADMRSPATGRPPDVTRIDELLANMDFISQFVAVRLAHAQIRERGETPDLLQRLIRGYSHLSLLTQHFWNATGDVFAARALLYAERLYASSNKSRDAIAVRAYARAICGTHALALEDIAELQKGEATSGSSDDLPDWFATIDAYCRFSRTQLQSAAAADPPTSQLATLLVARINDALGDQQQLVRLVPVAIDQLPEAYDLFPPLINQTTFGARTRGAHSALENFSRRLPERVAATREIPQSVRELAQSSAPATPGAVSENPLDSVASPLYPKGPAQLAHALAGATDEPAGDPSWRALAGMIREEAFVRVVNYFYHAQDIADTPAAQEGASLLTAGHRYERVIRSLTFDRDQRQSEEHNRLMGDLRVADPSVTMWRLYLRMWYVLSGNRYVGSTAFQEALDQRNLTSDYLIAAVRLSEQALRTDKSDRAVELHERCLALIQQVTPHCPVAVRAAMAQVAEPTPDQLAAWENVSTDDARASRSLGWRYKEMGRLDDAARLLEQSLSISPSEGALSDLAVVYSLSGRDDLLEPALARFSNTGDAGLAEARVRDRLARGHMSRGEWKQAEADALAAAESGATFALVTLSEVYEGLADFAISEEHVRKFSEASSGSGQLSWYFWCRRTGRGDLEAARARAKKFVDEPEEVTAEATASLGVYCILDGNHEGGLSYFRAAWERMPASDWYGLHYVFLLAERKNQAELDSAMIKLLNQNKADDPKTPTHIRDSVRLVVDQLADGERPELSADGLMAALDRMDHAVRTNYAYFFGRLAEMAGDRALAERCYRRALESGIFRQFNATLAGWRLTQLQGKLP